jgi:hypothetical protein
MRSRLLLSFGFLLITAVLEILYNLISQGIPFNKQSIWWLVGITMWLMCR